MTFSFPFPRSERRGNRGTFDTFIRLALFLQDRKRGWNFPEIVAEIFAIFSGEVRRMILRRFSLPGHSNRKSDKFQFDFSKCTVRKKEDISGPDWIDARRSWGIRKSRDKDELENLSPDIKMVINERAATGENVAGSAAASKIGRKIYSV